MTSIGNIRKKLIAGGWREREGAEYTGYSHRNVDIVILLHKGVRRWGANTYDGIARIAGWPRLRTPDKQN
jgi:hypothetical protein